MSLRSLYPVVILAFVPSLMLCGCRDSVGAAEAGRIPIVAVGDHYLYFDELASVMSADLIPEDSAEFADKYIKNWISEELLYQNASRNINDTREIDQRVENYRHTLIVHEYQQKLIEQKSVNRITEQDIIGFYEENQSLFILEEPIIKGVLIKLPLSAPNINRVRNWYTDTKAKSMDELEKYCIMNAVRYEPFYENWMPLSQIESILPVTSVSLETSLSKKKNLEVRDESFIYFLNVTNMVGRGEAQPLDNARTEIVRLLKNNKEVSFIENMKEDLYRDAVARDKIVFFNQEEK